MLLVVAADIAVLPPFVCLIPLLVHDAAAIRTKEYAGEQAHFIIAVGAFALLLHTLSCVTVYDRLVVVLKDYLLFFGIILALLYLVGHFLGLEVHKAARVFPVFKDMRHGVCRPPALIAGVVAACASRPAVFQRSRRGDFLLREHTGYLGRTVPGKAKAVYLLHYRGGFLVNDEIFVLVHEVAVHGLACDRLPAHVF